MAARKTTVSEKPQKNGSNNGSSNLENYQSQSLPEGFAEEILQYEMQLESAADIKIESVHRLLELYSIGVEYYESQGDQQFIFFHQKMNGLMVRPQVIDTMNQANIENQKDKSVQNTQPSKSEEEQIEQQKQQQQILIQRQQEEEMKMHLMYHAQEKQEKAQVILMNYQEDIKTKDNLIKKDLDEQQNSILNRLQRRKQTIMTRAASVPAFILAQTETESNCSEQEKTAAPTPSQDYAGESQKGPINLSLISQAINEDDEFDFPETIKTEPIQQTQQQLSENTNNEQNINETGIIEAQKEQHPEVSDFSDKPLGLLEISNQQRSASSTMQIRSKNYSIVQNEQTIATSDFEKIQQVSPNIDLNLQKQKSQKQTKQQNRASSGEKTNLNSSISIPSNNQNIQDKKIQDQSEQQQLLENLKKFSQNINIKIIQITLVNKKAFSSIVSTNLNSNILNDVNIESVINNNPEVTEQSTTNEAVQE